MGSQKQLSTVKFTGGNQNRQVAQSFSNNYPTAQSDISLKANADLVISSDPNDQGYVNGRSNSTQFRVQPPQSRLGKNRASPASFAQSYQQSSEKANSILHSQKMLKHKFVNRATPSQQTRPEPPSVDASVQERHVIATQVSSAMNPMSSDVDAA